MSESTQKRNPNIDAIRGLAVLGIFFINILFMGNTMLGYAPTEPAAASDLGVEIFSRIFLEGRFIGLFTLLFGVGLAIQYNSYSRTTDNPFVPIKKRLKVLMLFGLLHGVFIWPGDVLLTYGLSALLAISYLESELKFIRSRCLLFLGISLVSTLVMTQAIPFEELPARGTEAHLEELEPWIGGYGMQILQHLILMLMMNLFMLPIALMWYVGGMMLLGIYLYRSGFFSEGFAPAMRYRVMLAAIGAIAVDLALFNSETPAIKALSESTVLYSAIPVSLLYADLLIRICNGRTSVLAPLQRVGKLAFSLYILQSVVGILCFRYLFPDWLAHFDRLEYLLAAFSWALCQLLLASLYLRVFSQGPLEWLWRKLASTKTVKSSAQTEINT